MRMMRVVIVQREPCERGPECVRLIVPTKVPLDVYPCALLMVVR